MSRHKHHIIPRHLGGRNDPENLVEVSVIEHAKIHHSQWILSGRIQDKIAWLTLSGQISRDEARRMACSLACKGKPLSEETKKKISRSGIAYWAKQPRRPKPTKLTREEISRKISQRTKDAMAKFTEAQKTTMYLKRDSCDGRRWLHNSKGEHKRAKQYMVKSLLREGWIEGRLIKRSPTGQFTGKVDDRGDKSTD